MNHQEIFENQKMFNWLQKLLPLAHCHYSRFHVAAVVITDIGAFEGFNIEASAFANTMCAERVALFHALIKGSKFVKAIHLLTDDPDGKANMCGSCRQSLNDYVAANAVVYVYDHAGKFSKMYFYELLPEAFGKNSF